MENKEESICIIGAGISGLLACKYVLSKGFSPVVFESSSSIGGVWTKTLGSTKLQTTKGFFQFSDFPWSPSVDTNFPSSHQVLNYIRSYAKHFNLYPHIRFNSEVLSLSYETLDQKTQTSWTSDGSGELFSSNGTWVVTVQDTETGSTKIIRFKFVILCVGRFSDEPNVPEFPVGKGPEAFLGNVLHSIDYQNMDDTSASDFIKGKSVAVVGFQKSALDIAMECSNTNGVYHPCTLLYRTKHWNVPDYLPWGIPLGFLYLNRFSELLVHKPNEGFLLSLLATFLSPLRWMFSKLVESHIKNKLSLSKFGMVPEHSFLNEIHSCLISTVPHRFYNQVEDGSINLKNALSFGFCKNGILVGNDKQEEEEVVEADVVILCTGFRGINKLKRIFESTIFQDYIAGSNDAAVPLYRECIHPRIPQLAVIGFSESLSNLYTSEMRSRWVAELLLGTFKLPNVEEMEKDIAAWDIFKKKYSRNYYRRSCIGALHIWYNDQLCKDMGWNPNRKNGFLADLFLPYGPLDYTTKGPAPNL
ncbi:OLC1v1035402C1 [Oldenlandia corymbosa var. corymbosa]|uniref:Flavin-containing monooxygenase n=1 Tax=Oldenlandia corymbosa var. corymbosa TaxID=529605 RepID=A0AAV1CSZ0_OLDCO|nr:OLC1v1035402C1 [Oldenlandia corymbosa var. corymbosa]